MKKQWLYLSQDGVKLASVNRASEPDLGDSVRIVALDHGLVKQFTVIGVSPRDLFAILAPAVGG